VNHEPRIGPQTWAEAYFDAWVEAHRDEYKRLRERLLGPFPAAEHQWRMPLFKSLPRYKTPKRVTA
jgi:hypothetical protein